MADEYLLQERCGKRAQEVFDKSNPKQITRDENGIESSTYTNHYNKRLNKCFAVITVIFISKDKSKSGSYKQVQLYDINENKEYGVLFTEIDFLPQAQYKPIQCTFLTTQCQSQEEWSTLAKPYMEE